MPRRSLIHDSYIIGGIIVSIIIIFLAVALALTRTSLLSRAAETSQNTSISRENSYVFASPISAIADGISTIRITVFLLNNQGLGVSGQKVSVKSSKPIKINPITPESDNFGRSIFDVTSDVAGSYTLSAEVAGTILPQTVSLSFR
jgi:hypothetical protein